EAANVRLQIADDGVRAQPTRFRQRSLRGEDRLARAHSRLLLHSRLRRVDVFLSEADAIGSVVIQTLRVDLRAGAVREHENLRRLYEVGKVRLCRERKDHHESSSQSDDSIHTSSSIPEPARRSRALQRTAMQEKCRVT